MGIPYLPVTGLVGSDLIADCDDAKILPNPFAPEEETLVVTALRPDVAVFHALAADPFGNVEIGAHTDDILLAEAAKMVIVTAEKMVERVDMQHCQGTFLPGLLVHHVVHVAYGAHPAGMQGLYAEDAFHMKWYVKQAQTRAGFAQYIQKTVHEVHSHKDYISLYGSQASDSKPCQSGAAAG